MGFFCLWQKKVRSLATYNYKKRCCIIQNHALIRSNAF